MNELIFICHVALVAGFALLGCRLGKTGLIGLIALQGVLANLFVVKQILLFGFAVTCSDVFAVGGILSLNLLQEYFGKEAAKEAVRVSLLTLLFFAGMAQVHLLYTPAACDETQGAFQTIFSSSGRIVLASIATFYLVQKFDVQFFSWLKGRFPIRVAVSLIVSQLLDTVLFTFLGLYGLVASLTDVILLSFLIKCLVILASAPFVSLSKKVVRHVPV